LTGIQQKLAAIFQGEHAEHLEHIRSILALLENLPDTKGRIEIDEAFRRAHTLKGAARVVDLPAVEGLAAGLETLFSRVRQGTLLLDKRIARVVHQVLDASENIVGAIRENRIPGDPAAALRAIGDLLEIGPPAAASPLVPPPPAAPAVAPAPPAGLQAAEMVRLPAENLDRLVRTTGLIVKESLRQTGIGAQLDALDTRLAEAAAECFRFHRTSGTALLRLAAQPEYSAVVRYLEFVEQKARSVAALSTRVRRFHTQSARGSETLAEQLQRDVWSARMAPAEDLFEGFRKMVADLARDENKEIDFRLSGAAVRADRMVLQALQGPVMHLLRNAISHGIETPEERRHHGKSLVGSLTLRLHAQKGRLIVEVEDDGRGVDLKKVADVLSQAEPWDHSAGELTSAIFRPGFSTAPAVSRLSGRGMGLSVVYETARRLQGDASLRPITGPGACFVLSVPLSVSTSHLLLVSAAGQTFGIPTHAIERLYRIGLDRVETQAGRPVVNLEGRATPLFSLARLLRIGDEAPSIQGDKLPVMVLKSGSGRFAVWADAFLAERDALIQKLGMPCPASGNISGGALLREGTVFVVLNPAGLVESCGPSVAAPVPSRAAPRVDPVAPGILVVDDSATSRYLERSILEAHGYRVRVAVDGLEALDLLGVEKPDLIVTDIQMPRLDGFGLMEALKADARFSRIPVIIVSSLERTEDRERGLLLGADAHVVKRRFDQKELLDAIRQMI
jgi:two-component system chemotaxis sensor kinase CheA